MFSGDKVVFPPPGLFSYARYALVYYLLYLSTVKKKEIKNILLPDYMCHEVGSALRGCGYQPFYYSLDRNFDVPLDFLDDLKRAQIEYQVMLVAHFYGKVSRNLRLVTRVCRERENLTRTVSIPSGQ